MMLDHRLGIVACKEHGVYALDDFEQYRSCRCLAQLHLGIAKRVLLDHAADLIIAGRDAEAQPFIDLAETFRAIKENV